MEKDDFLKDDFLRELIQRSPLDSPSDGFVDRVMANVHLSTEVAAVKKPVYQYFKASIPYTLIILILLVVISSSDLPIFNWFPGKEYFVDNFMHYFGTLPAVLKNSFASKFVSWALLISFSVGILFLFDLLFSRRTSV